MSYKSLVHIDLIKSGAYAIIATAVVYELSNVVNQVMLLAFIVFLAIGIYSVYRESLGKSLVRIVVDKGLITRRNQTLRLPVPALGIGPNAVANVSSASRKYQSDYDKVAHNTIMNLLG